MTHRFDIREEIELPATPEQVWAAIATGPGIDSWFMGHTEIEPRAGGKTTFAMPGMSEPGTVTVWEPGSRFAYQSDTAPDGTFMAFEYLLEARDADTTVLRFVHSGFLSDDWEDEYDALTKGDRMYLGKLASYLRYFPGRTSTFSVMIWGPQVADAGQAWSAFASAAGLSGTGIGVGDRGDLSIGRSAGAEAIVDYAVYPDFLGLRTSDSIYRFMHGYKDTIVVEQQSFTGGEPDRKLAEEGWQDWIKRTF